MPEALGAARNVRWEIRMNQLELQRKVKKPQVLPENSLLHNPGSCLSAEMRWAECSDQASCRGFSVSAKRVEYAALIAPDLHCFWGGARGRNKRRTQKSINCAFGEESSFLTSEVWELIIVITLQVLSVQRTLLIAVPLTSKVQSVSKFRLQCQKRSSTTAHVGWLHKRSRIKH